MCLDGRRSDTVNTNKNIKTPNREESALQEQSKRVQLVLSVFPALEPIAQLLISPEASRELLNRWPKIVSQSGPAGVRISGSEMNETSTHIHDLDLEDWALFANNWNTVLLYWNDPKLANKSSVRWDIAEMESLYSRLREIRRLLLLEGHTSLLAAWSQAIDAVCTTNRNLLPNHDNRNTDIC